MKKSQKILFVFFIILSTLIILASVGYALFMLVMDDHGLTEKSRTKKIITAYEKELEEYLSQLPPPPTEEEQNQMDLEALEAQIADDVDFDDEEIEYSQKNSISLLFAGDLYPTDVLQGKYRNSGISACATDELLDITRSADCFMLNQEFPFGASGEAADKTYTFRVDPSFITIEEDLGVDLVTLANNHMLDYGRACLSDNFATLQRAGMPYVGAGKDRTEAADYYIFEQEDVRVGFLGATRVVPDGSWGASSSGSGLFMTYDSSALCERIKIAKTVCDYVVVYVHWGVEKNNYHEGYQTDLAKAYINAGADAVIGAHPHVLQGITSYKDKPIFYSLGNFIFNNGSYDTMMVKLEIPISGGEITGKPEVSLVPLKSNSNLMSVKSDAASFREFMQSLSPDVVIDDSLHVKY